MSTIHNPANFEPTDYRVVGYLDNQPPKYFAGPVEAYEKAREAWLAGVRVHFPGWPAGDAPSLHRCCHCGNGTVRYITVCLHKPSGKKVIFGSDCEARLGFEGHNAFAAEHIRTHAANEAVRIKRERARHEFLGCNPEFTAALAGLRDNPAPHKSNSFVHDIAAKFEANGTLSEAQVEAFLKSIDRDIAFARRREAERAAAGPVPTGRAGC